MSDTATIQLQINDEAALAAACTAMGLPAPVRGVADLFETKGHRGLILRFPGWRYPVILDPATGTAHYDVYHGQWGNPADFQKLQQHYGLQRAKALALRAGKTVTQKVKADGTLTLVIGGV